ncbi:MAG: hypothetical protein Q4A58_05615 [Fusobacterium sp.]|uniref:hypothetical protein n=1 Tax=Fusobacterium sp. TaxID=68766 RepID=UPI0026DD7A4B|nr:hypothetical protein [Fusobacterium sp.]MDO4690757.1 hypothetical protein [Fusobacterium sp.]
MKKNLFFYFLLLMILSINKLKIYGKDNIGFLNYSNFIVSPSTQKESVYRDLCLSILNKENPFRNFEREYKKLLNQKDKSITWQDFKSFAYNIEFNLNYFYNDMMNGVKQTTKNKPLYKEIDRKAEEVLVISFKLKDNILSILKYYKNNINSIDEIKKLNSDYFLFHEAYIKESKEFINEFNKFQKTLNPDRFNTNDQIIEFSKVMDEFFSRLSGYVNSSSFNVDIYEKIIKEGHKDYENLVNEKMDELNTVHSYLKDFNLQFSKIQIELEKQTEKDLEAGEIPKEKYKKYLEKNKIFIDESKKLEEIVKRNLELRNGREIIKASKDLGKKLDKVFDKYFHADKAYEALFNR